MLNMPKKNEFDAGQPNIFSTLTTAKIPSKFTRCSFEFILGIFKNMLAHDIEMIDLQILTFDAKSCH